MFLLQLHGHILERHDCILRSSVQQENWFLTECLITNERWMLLHLNSEVAEPLRAMVMRAPLEDARHLAQRYDRVRQEASQAVEISRRQAKLREGTGQPDMAYKLEAPEAKLEDLKSNTNTLVKEAVAAMAAVEAQQQRLTLQRLIAMVSILLEQCIVKRHHMK